MNVTGKSPNIVYKYRSWSKNCHKDLVLKNQLYFASPKDFNDPFDCRIPANFSLLDTDEKIEKYIALKIKEHSEQNPESIDDFKEKTKDFKSRLLKNPAKLQEEYNSLLFSGHDNHYGVLSLSIIWNSILMWSHYANNHSGYCVGLCHDKLKSTIPVLLGGRVNYPSKDGYPEISPLEGEDTFVTIRQTHTKSQEWLYEQEFRLTKVFYPKPASLYDRIQIVPDSCFAEIIIGLKAESQTISDLIEIGKQKNIPVYQTKMVPFKFKLERERIQ